MFFQEGILHAPPINENAATIGEMNAPGAARRIAKGKNATCRWHCYYFLAIEGFKYKRRIELPKCLVKQIRKQFPDPGTPSSL